MKLRQDRGIGEEEQDLAGRPMPVEQCVTGEDERVEEDEFDRVEEHGLDEPRSRPGERGQEEDEQQLPGRESDKKCLD